MTAVKSTHPIHGVVYNIYTAVGNSAFVKNGQPQLSGSDPVRTPSTPTMLLVTSGITRRLNASQATAQASPVAGSSFTDADGNITKYSAAVPLYAGGAYQSANTGGLRMSVGGEIVDFTATNLTDLATVMNAFAAAGAVV